MKARYYKDDSILDAKTRKQQSYGWSSLLVGIDLLKKGTRYLIGDGKSIKLGMDNCIDSHPPRPIKASVSSSALTLDSLFRFHGPLRAWDPEKISEFVAQEDQDIIQRIYLSKEAKPDNLVWNYNSSGDYTVRSGYWLLTHDPHSAISSDRPHGSVELKNKVWQLPIMPKIKHFLWRMLSRALATNERLTTRGMQIDSTCPRCRNSVESINHALFTCSVSSMVWRLSNTPFYGSQMTSDDLEENFIHVLNLLQSSTLTEVQKLLPFWLLWRLWKSRNNVVFNNFRESLTTIVLQATAETKEWIEATNIQRRRFPQQAQQHPIVKSWTAPQRDYVKCNFDAGLDLQNLQAKGGWIIRDYEGSPKAWGSMVLHYAGSPLEAEALALLAALQQVWIRGYTNVVMEGDCEILINLVNGAPGILSVANYLLDIHHWASKFVNIQFSFVKRTGNQVAHNLARFGCISSCYYADSVHQPVWLHQSICNDFSKLI